MPIKANQISQEVKLWDAISNPPVPGSEQGIFYPKKFGDVVEACFKNNQGSEIQLTVNGVAAGEANTAASVGSGTSLVGTKSGSELRFKSIKEGPGIAIAAYDSNTVQISCTVVAGEVNDGLNVGVSGIGIFKSKDGTTKALHFKKLVAGSNIDISEANDMITISVSNLAQNVYTGSNVGTGEGNVFKEIANNDFKFKRIKAGNNVSISETTTEITISSTGGAGSGETNTASNSAAGTGLGLFKQKVGVDLVFKKIKAGAGLSITSYDDDLEINLSGGVGEANTASNATAGTGTGLLFKAKSGTDLVFRKLKAGTGVTLTTTTDDVLIDVTGGGGGGGEVNTASNLGTGSDGEGLASTKNGVDLPFKRIKAGSNITVTPATNSLTIAAIGDINAGANMGSGSGIFSAKSGNTLQFKTLKAGANITLDTSVANEISISAASGGGGTAISTYSASAVSGDECMVTATGAGITYARVGDTGTFTIPNGVQLLSFMVRVPGAAITAAKFVVAHGQGGNSQAAGYPPIIQVYNDASTTTWKSTAAHSATSDGTNTGAWTSSLITGLSNGVAYRVRGAF